MAAEFVVLSTVHEVPPRNGGGLTPCCRKTIFELPRTDRTALDPQLVTCGKDPMAVAVTYTTTVTIDVTTTPDPGGFLDRLHDTVMEMAGVVEVHTTDASTGGEG